MTGAAISVLRAMNQMSRFVRPSILDLVNVTENKSLSIDNVP